MYFSSHVLFPTVYILIYKHTPRIEAYDYVTMSKKSCYYVTEVIDTIYGGSMKEEDQKDTKQFNLKVPVTLIERYKTIQERKGVNNYLEVLEGLVKMYEDIVKEMDEKDAQR